MHNNHAAEFRAKAEISSIAAELLPEERRGSLVCPFCDGGQSRERSFGVGKGEDGAVYYKCFRVHCGRSGTIGRQRNSGGVRTERPKTVEEVILPELCRLEGPWVPKLLSLGDYEMALAAGTELGWKTSNKGTSLWIPLRSCDQTCIGWEERRIEGQPKSRVFRLQKDSFIRNSFHRSLGADEHADVSEESVLVVEDSISAIKARSVISSYSLQGTNFTTDHLFELTASHHGGLILLALDRDATQKAAGLIRKFRFYSKFLRLCPLQKDVKHLTIKEIKELIKPYV